MAVGEAPAGRPAKPWVDAAAPAVPAAFTSVGGPPDRPPGIETRYGGLATRIIAFVIDAAAIDVVALIVTAAAALIVSLFRLPSDVQTLLKLIGAAAYVLWVVGYFIGFWSTTGQTPGDRVMQIRVITSTGDRVRARRGIVRCIGMALGAIPLFAGYALILFDRQRRAFHDRLAGTVVIEAPGLSLAEMRRLSQREANSAARGQAASATAPHRSSIP